MGIANKIKEILFSQEEMDEAKRAQFIQGFKRGYSDPSAPEEGEAWYKLGVAQGKSAYASSMTTGKVSFPEISGSE